jgi:hypothetical protein
MTSRNLIVARPDVGLDLVFSVPGGLHPRFVDELARRIEVRGQEASVLDAFLPRDVLRLPPEVEHGGHAVSQKQGGIAEVGPRTDLVVQVDVGIGQTGQ